MNLKGEGGGMIKIRDEDPTFFSTDPDPAQLKKNPDLTPDPT